MYNHPGHLFLEHHTSVQTLDDVLAYVSFLRRRANIDDVSPANLPAIYEHFGIPTPKRAALPNQQGLLLIPEIGLILINRDDLETRQRFTEAHELMELLFNALPDGKGWALHQKGPFNMGQTPHPARFFTKSPRGASRQKPCLSGSGLTLPATSTRAPAAIRAAPTNQQFTFRKSSGGRSDG